MIDSFNIFNSEKILGYHSFNNAKRIGLAKIKGQFGYLNFKANMETVCGKYNSNAMFWCTCTCTRNNAISQSDIWIHHWYCRSPNMMSSYITQKPCSNHSPCIQDAL